MQSKKVNNHEESNIFKTKDFYNPNSSNIRNNNNAELSANRDSLPKISPNITKDYRQIFKGKSNTTRLKELTGKFNKVSNAKPFNIIANSNEQEDSSNSKSRKEINAIQRNASVKAIRDNRLIIQLNDFKIKEDKSEIRPLKYEQLPKILESSKINNIRKKVKLLSQVTTTGGIISANISNNNILQSSLTKGVVSINTGKNALSINVEEAQLVKRYSDLNTKNEESPESKKTRTINYLNHSNNSSNRIILNHIKKSSKNIVQDNKLVIEKNQYIEKGIYIPNSSRGKVKSLKNMRKSST